MVKGGTPRRGVEEHPRLLLRLRGPAAVGEPGGLQVRGRDQPAQPGHRRPDVRLRVHQGRSRTQATDVYTEQCSISVNAKDLATMAATLANGGKNPVTRQAGDERRRTCPTCWRSWRRPASTTTRASGSTTPACRPRAASAAASSPWLPGKFGIAVISPPLDDAGNSVRAQKAIAEIVARLNANPYAVKPS